MKVYTFQLTTLIIALGLAALHLAKLDQAGNNLILDGWFRLRGQITESNDIVLVALDQRFIDEYPVRLSELDRRFYAQAITHLTEAGATVIAMDIFFPEPSQADRDEALASTILSNNVILPFVRLSDSSSSSIHEHVPFNPLLEQAKRGVLELAETARSFRPIVSFQEAQLPSFALAVVEAAGLSSKYRQTQPLLIDYLGPAGSFPQLSFLDVYRDTFAYSHVIDKIVLIGVTLEGTDRDQIITPFGMMSGLEVNANQVYTLLNGNLKVLNPLIYAFLLIGIALIGNYLAPKKRGLFYSLLAIGLSVLLSFIFFRLHLFISPLSPILLFGVAYGLASFQQLRNLDNDLNKKLIELLDSATFSRLDTPTPDSLQQGFAPKGYVADTDKMLESLQHGLGASAGLLIFKNERAEQGVISPRLVELAKLALEEKRPIAEGTMPHYIVEPMKAQNQTIGILALSLPAPPPPHLRSLLLTSLNTFSQVARYQNLRMQTQTLTTKIWPRASQSSYAKLEALGMIGDLLAAERGWLGTLLESLPQAVFIMSPYGFSIYKNASARRLLGDEKNMLRGIPEALSIDLMAFQENYVKMVEQGDTLELGLTERKSNRSILLSMQVVRDGPEIRGVAGTINDLSKLSELDQQRQDLIAMVVHDLRSPLTSIQGFAELLLSGSLTDNREPLEIISDEAARMRRLTDSFLDLSRLESESFKPEKQAANVAD